MKFLVVSDIHGNLSALNFIINYINNNNIELILNLGDLIGSEESKEVLKTVLDDKRFVNVVGNHDTGHYDWILEEMGDHILKKVKEIPLKRIITIENKKFLMLHSRECSNSERPLLFDNKTLEEFVNDYKTECDYVLFGHTHYQNYTDFVVGKTVLNPGSLGLSYDGMVSFLEVDINKNEISFNFKKVNI